MSRVGKRVLKIPEGVTITNNNNVVNVKGPKGELEKEFSKDIIIKQKDGALTTDRKSNERRIKMLHGTTNSLIDGMIKGVTVGFFKELEIIGVGYNVKVENNKITLSLGLSHKVVVDVPSDLKVESDSQTTLKVSGIDKQKVGEFAAKIKAFRKPEPYGGKGIRYKGEHIIRKAGKASK